jgi:hypothetical protein
MPCFATGGAEWCNDYTVITRRRGDLKAWGLRDTYGSVAHTGMKKLTTTHARFVNKNLTAAEHDALRTYTTGRHLGASQRQQTVKPTAQQRYRP